MVGGRRQEHAKEPEAEEEPCWYPARYDGLFVFRSLPIQLYGLYVGCMLAPLVFAGLIFTLWTSASYRCAVVAGSRKSPRISLCLDACAVSAGLLDLSILTREMRQRKRDKTSTRMAT